MRVPIAFTLAVAVAGPATAAAAEKGSSGGIIETEDGYVEVLPEAPPAGTTVRLKEGWIRVESVPDDEEPGSGSFGVISSGPLLAQAETPAQRRPPPPYPTPPPDGQVAPGYAQPQPAPQPAPPPGVQPAPYAQAGEPAYEQPYEQRPGTRTPRPGENPNVDVCYEEQEQYAKELFRIAGIEDVEHPLALLQGVGATPGLSPWVRFNIFGAPYLGPYGVSWIDPIRPLAWDDRLQWAAQELTGCVRRNLGFDDRLYDPDTTAQPTSAPPNGGSL